ncbi:MAG: hypothetical protein E7363_04325 [Clostridiales bacterium]|nr:hypothetical protein [Clostridiales bacterium]
MRKSVYAIDIGSSNVKIYRSGEGVVLSEPSVVAVSSGEKRVVKAVGLDAKKIIGKTAENTFIVCPISEGGVTNERMAVEMLSAFLKKVQGGDRISSAFVSVPCGMGEVDLYKLGMVLKGAGVQKYTFVQNPVCAALGMNVPLNEYTPCFLVDMGGSVTNVAALSLDGIIAGLSLSLGGSNIDAQLIDYVASEYRLKIGLLTAERLKQQIGSLIPGDRTTTVVNGRSVDTGRPCSISLNSQDVLEPMRLYFDRIAEVIHMVLSKLPAEVSAEIRHAGIMICGGTSKVAGATEYLAEKLEMDVVSGDNPELAAVVGAGIIAGDKELAKQIKLSF